MAESQEDRFTIESLKQRIQLILKGVGIKIFLYIIIAVGIILLFTIGIVGHYYPNLYGLFAIVILFGGFLWISKQISLIVQNMGSKKLSLPLFFTSKDWQHYVNKQLQSRVGSNKTGFKQLTDTTKLGQPQFASNERDSEITGVIMEGKS